MRDRLVALEAERGPAVVALEDERQHAHADEVRAVDALEALGDHGAHAEQVACPWPPSRATSRCRIPCRRRRRAARPRPCSASPRRRSDMLLAVGLVDGEAALRLPRATIWFLMRMLAKVPRIITSWLPRRAPYWLKSAGRTWCSSRYLPAGDCRLDRAGRRDVVGGDRVAEEAEDARVDDVGDRLRRPCVMPSK